VPPTASAYPLPPCGRKRSPGHTSASLSRREQWLAQADADPVELLDAALRMRASGLDAE